MCLLDSIFKQRFNDSITRYSFTRWLTFAFFYLLFSTPSVMTTLIALVTDFFIIINIWWIYDQSGLCSRWFLFFITFLRFYLHSLCAYWFDCMHVHLASASWLLQLHFLSFHFLFSFPFHGVRVWKRHTGQRWNRALHCNISGLPIEAILFLDYISISRFFCFVAISDNRLHRRSE